MSITFFLVALIIAIILGWITATHGAWRIHEGKHDPQITPDTVLAQADKALRLARRGLYSVERTAGQALHWSGNKTAKAVVKAFPTTAPLFKEKVDALTGLSHGPSSYFLKSISEKKPEKKRSTVRKNML